MLPGAAARRGLGYFYGALLALMTVPDPVAGSAWNLRGGRCQRVNGLTRETTEPQFRPCSVRGTGKARRDVQGQAATAPLGGLDIRAVPSDISVMTEKTDKKKLPAVG